MRYVLECLILIATQEAASFHSEEPGGREVQGPLEAVQVAYRMLVGQAG